VQQARIAVFSAFLAISLIVGAHFPLFLDIRLFSVYLFFHFSLACTRQTAAIRILLVVYIIYTLARRSFAGGALPGGASSPPRV